ncbi:MAG: hypothetical protein HC797_06105, partial [Anaerolineales bacterium]|nr:hypothetical protein [Anaerolineales bacterium]
MERVNPANFLWSQRCFFQWWALFIAGGLVVLVAILRTLWIEREVNIEAYFFPNFLWSLRVVTSFLVGYQVLATIAKRLSDLRSRADKLKWTDVEFNLLP